MDKSFTWLYVLGFGIFTIQVLVVCWAQKAIPAKDILNKYSRGEVFRSRLPFIESWKQHINIEDQPAFYKYRERLFLAQATIILTITLLILFGHLWLTYRDN